MKVYLVIDCCSNNVVGVFDSSEKAIKYIEDNDLSLTVYIKSVEMNKGV